MARAKPQPRQTFYCEVCGKGFLRNQAQIKKSTPRWCSRDCQSKGMSGKNNPFWNKSHSEKTRKKISDSRKGKQIGNQHAKGYAHSEEAKKKISEASKEMWKKNRDKMIASLPRGEDHIFHKPPEERRYRKEFTPYQRREWKDDHCAYCGTTKNLVLDHIIPVFDGGTNIKENAQTLCQGCNIWKVYLIDLPRRNAKLAIDGGQS
jgi:hypothetical protein